ncbi:MAG: Gfo/Idh/MocA family protein, partial [Pirellula sp.]
MNEPTQRPSRRDAMLNSVKLTSAGITAGLVACHSSNGAWTARKLRVGQIGTMHGHATKLSVYRKSSDYEVVGIAEPDSQSKASAQKHPAFVDLQWLSIDQLLNIPDLDVVLVETQVKDSLDIALRCVQAGKHIHLDKPAGESLEQFERILRIAQDKQLVVQMGYMYRYNPAWLMLKELHSK